MHHLTIGKYSTPPGYATTNTCESFNKIIKEDYTINKKLHNLDCFAVMEKMIINYSANDPFKLYPCSLNHDKSVVEKPNSLNIKNFFQINVNIIRFYSTSKTPGLSLTFIDLAYSHHLLAINRLIFQNFSLYLLF